MGNSQPLSIVFFDVGNTLGSTKVTADGQLTLALFPTTLPMLRVVNETLGLLTGIISNIPEEMTTEQFQTALGSAGLSELLDKNCIVTSRDAGAGKPDARIYEFAARQAGVPAYRCLYVGETEAEVLGAMAAGMSGVLKPVLHSILS
jgi:FMN phosphatase YigB (HAD superfamily)